MVNLVPLIKYNHIKRQLQQSDSKLRFSIFPSPFYDLNQACADFERFYRNVSSLRRRDVRFVVLYF